MEAAFGEDFGQRVDLTQRIREVLANYPEGPTILKELLQNADDAQATKVAFCLDRRTHGTRSLAHAPLAPFQGPALLVHNNAVFTEADFESISRVGDSRKRVLAWKTGRFGIGFNSVYHLTDLPSFVSDQYIVFFDPHCSHLPKVSASNPGKRINFVTTRVLDSAHDQFSPYQAFGCDMESPYGSTLFRFPLRTPEQAARSKLSRQAYTAEDMATLLKDFQDEAVYSLLFLKSVESIELYDWLPDAERPILSFRCQIDSPDSILRQHRQAYARLAASVSGSVPGGGPGFVNDMYYISFVSEVYRRHDSKGLTEVDPVTIVHRRMDSFLISQAMGSPDTRIGKLSRDAAQLYDMNLTPWASVAAQLFTTNESLPHGMDKATVKVSCRGQAFCFLPLPVFTNLPVHVNGYFELSSNRREIWYGDDMDRGGRLRSDWNRCLLEDVATPAYVQLLLEATRKVGPGPEFTSLFPTGTFSEPWKGMVSKFYMNISECPLLHTRVEGQLFGSLPAIGGGRWVVPSSAIFHDEQFFDPDGLERALVREGLPIVRVPQGVRDFLFKYSVPKPKVVLPSSIREHMKLPRFHGSLADRTDAMLILEYCLGDLVDDEASEALMGLKIAPLADKSLGTFWLNEVGKEIVISQEGLEYDLLLKGRMERILVDRDGVKHELLERLTNIARLSTGGNLSILSVPLLIRLLPSFFPLNWKHGEEHIWPQNSLGHPSEEWLVLFWQYVRGNFKTLASLEGWPLLPVQGGKLFPLKMDRSRVLDWKQDEEGLGQDHKIAGEQARSIDGDGEGERDSRIDGLDRCLKDLLVKVGCFFLRKDISVEHPEIGLYVHDFTAMGVLDALSAIAQYKEMTVNDIMALISPEERRSLRNFLYNPRWYEGSQMNERRLQVFRGLPIFEAYTLMDRERDSGSESTGEGREECQRDVYFVHLLGPAARFLPPSGVDEALLSSEFIKSANERESAVLIGPLGLRRLPRPLFYKRQVMARINDLPPDLLNKTVLVMLRELPQLCALDKSMREAMAALAFLPTSEAGVLRRPHDLYDPRNSELKELLEDKDWFPRGDFAEPDILDMLQGLGLQTAVTLDTVLLSARAVEELLSVDSERARNRGQALLAYLELNSGRWLSSSLQGGGRMDGDLNRPFNRMFTRMSSLFQNSDTADAEAAELARFWQELSTISWCPVLTDPPYLNLPWPAVVSSTAPPKLVRLASDTWLVSASMRILDGECRSAALSAKLGWSRKPGGSVLAAQLLELGKLKVEVGPGGKELGQALATAVPQLYKSLGDLLGTEEMEIVKAVLQGSHWVWVGDSFCTTEDCAFAGPLNLAPYLRVVPSDLAAFKDLLIELGVRETLTSVEYARVLKVMSEDKKGSPLEPRLLEAAVWLVQHLADMPFGGEAGASWDGTIYCPDTQAVLVPVGDLVFNDAPWMTSDGGLGVGGSPVVSPLGTGTKIGLSEGPGGRAKRPDNIPVYRPQFVHAKISNDVAERLGVRSFRRLMLSESADSMDLSLHDAAEAFGQHEALTTRLKHIVDMYTDGPGILCELVQNADDAGAREVVFLLDRGQYGTSSVLSPRMADWQGPSLYCFNDSVFTQKDLYAISRIGQDSKLEKPSAIGRFGLGFNSVYHFTDVPGFVSGQTLVIFDPHACNLPGITPSHPGLKISFVGRNLLEQFPDQFRPYLLFGCDLQRPFPGTLFRFPLRSAVTAPLSEIKQEAYTTMEVMELLKSFQQSGTDALLFLRNVMKISVFVREDIHEEPNLLYEIQRTEAPLVTTMGGPLQGSSFLQQQQMFQQSPSLRSVYEFIRGDPHNPIDKVQFYRKLQRTSENQLPWYCGQVTVTTTTPTGPQLRSRWVICNSLGGGRAREYAVASENLSRGFVPLAGVAARLTMEEEGMTFVTERQERGFLEGSKDVDGSVLQPSESQAGREQEEGRAFCFLPLPVKIGLPVHVNGYFELSSNRRDIWYGDDMVRGGKLRSDWNLCLLEDVAAPAYARLLSATARCLGQCTNFQAMWPLPPLQEPWLSLARKVYLAIMDLELPVLYTEAGGGRWISAKRAVFPDLSFEQSTGLTKALVSIQLPVVDVPGPVVKMFSDVCPNLRYLSPQLLRTILLVGSKRNFGGMETVALILQYCLRDVTDEDAGERLHGLSLVPLADGSVGTIMKGHMASKIIVASQEERQLLEVGVRHMLVNSDIDEAVYSRLFGIAGQETTNLQRVSAGLVAELMHWLVPGEWKGRDVVEWRPRERHERESSLQLTESVETLNNEEHPSIFWLELLWKYFNLHCQTASDLEVFKDWPILPTADGKLRRLQRGAPILRHGNWSENMLSLLTGAGVVFTSGNVQFDHSGLSPFVHDSTAFGVLDSLLAARGMREGKKEKLSTLMSVGELLEGASDGERRELRSYLLQSKWFTHGQMNDARVHALQSLPVFESYGTMPGGGRHFVHLPAGACFFAPSGVEEILLGSNFVRADTERERELLADFLGVQEVTRTTFYRDNIFPRIGNLTPELRTRAVRKILEELPVLASEDVTFRISLAGLAFVPNAKGELRTSGSLYDPRVPELRALLDYEVFFPSSEFESSGDLDILVGLGLQRELNRRGLLDSAKSIQLMQTLNRTEASIRASALLSHLDEHQLSIDNESLLQLQSDPSEEFSHRNSRLLNKSHGNFEDEFESTWNPFIGGSIPHSVDLGKRHAYQMVEDRGSVKRDDVDQETFWKELANLSWCPVLFEPPDSHLPWSQGMGVVAPPRLTRLRSDMWLVSGSMRILDRNPRSQSLIQNLGWNQRPSASCLAAQLVELSLQFSECLERARGGQVEELEGKVGGMERRSKRGVVEDKKGEEGASPLFVRGENDNQKIGDVDTREGHDSAGIDVDRNTGEGDSEASLEGMSEREEEEGGSRRGQSWEETELEKFSEILSREIPRIFQHLEEIALTPEQDVVKSILDRRSWVWVGDNFVAPNRLAFDSPAHFHPYLYIVPSEIAIYRELLVALGVRERFDARDYARVLNQMAQDSKGKPLTPEQRSFALRVIEALVEVGSSESGLGLSFFGGGVYIPDAMGVLVPAKDLVFNDAAWLVKNGPSGVGASRQLVHPDVPNDIAEQLGAKSLRYLSLVDQEMTNNLPCLPAGIISELLNSWRDRDLLFFDFLEIADACGAKRMDVVYDRREHPRQSLLQPNLGAFQCPSITIFLDGVTLSTDEVCLLQAPPPAKLKGHVLNYGSGLLGAYHITDLPIIASDSCLYLFDPSGSTLGNGRGGPGGVPAGKSYSLKGTDIVQRFSDQFKPLQVAPTKQYSWIDGTIIRLPLRTEEQVQTGGIQRGVPCGDAEVAEMMDCFKAHAATSMLFLKSVETVTLSVWEEESNSAEELFAVLVKPNEAPLRKAFDEKKWRGKFQLQNLFGGFNASCKLQPISVQIRGPSGTQPVVDKWLVVQSLGSGRSRDMALDRKYLSYNLTPVAGVAAKILYNGEVILPTSSESFCLYSPFPLLEVSGLPVVVSGNFMVLRGWGRRLFQTFPSTTGLPERGKTGSSSTVLTGALPKDIQKHGRSSDINQENGTALTGDILGKSSTQTRGSRTHGDYATSGSRSGSNSHDRLERNSPVLGKGRVVRHGVGGNPGAEALGAMWNKELMACVREAYVELLTELFKLRVNVGGSYPEKNFEGSTLLKSEQVYDFWPRSGVLRSRKIEFESSLERGADLNRETLDLGFDSHLREEGGEESTDDIVPADMTALREWLIKPLYVRLSELPLWLLHGGGLVRIAEGLFLAPPSAEREGYSTPQSVGTFLKSHYRVFSAPWELMIELKLASIPVKELTPKMLRSLLRSPEVVASTLRIATQVQLDLLEYCVTDVIESESETETNDKGGNKEDPVPVSNPTRGTLPLLPIPLPAENRSIRSAGTPMVSGLESPRYRGNIGEVFRSNNSTNIGRGVGGTTGGTEGVGVGFRALLSERDGLEREFGGRREGGGGERASFNTTPGDPLALMADLGRAIVDFGRDIGRNVLLDIEGASNGPVRSTEREEEQEEPESFKINVAAVAELKGICIPNAAGTMARLSVSECLLATAQQQTLLPSLSHRFIHPLFITRPMLSQVLSLPSVCEILNLKKFSANILAEGIPSTLPRAWAPTASPPLPWFEWNPPPLDGFMVENSSHSNNFAAGNFSGNSHPSEAWLQCFWENVNVDKPHEVSLFDSWPLIPAEIGIQHFSKTGGNTSVVRLLVRLELRRVVFVPPENRDLSLQFEEKEDETGGGMSNSTEGKEDDRIEKENSFVSIGQERSEGGERIKRRDWRFQLLEREKPWLLPLLKQLGVPILDQNFLDSPLLKLVTPDIGLGLPKLVLAKLQALQNMNQFSPRELRSLSPPDCDSLFSLFASQMSSHSLPFQNLLSSPPGPYDSQEVEFLRSLPIYRSVLGEYVSVDPAVHCIVPSGLFFQPENERCLQYRGEVEAKALYTALQIPELADNDIMARFALPTFESLSEEERERILNYLQANWIHLKSDPTVLAALKETKFVSPATNVDSLSVANINALENNKSSSTLVRPCDLLDPHNVLLKRVFADDIGKFPGKEFVSSRWLGLLRDAGLKTSLDAELLLECAKKIEVLGKTATAQNSVQKNEFSEGEAFLREGEKGVVGMELWALAGDVVEAILQNFAVVFGSRFCEPLSSVRFVPAILGIPTGGPSDRRHLASYTEAVLPRDWPLAWTCAPVLSRGSVVPPEFAWSILHLRSPPPFATVLKHLQLVGENGGEDVLARWPNIRGCKSTEEAFGDVLSYLSGIWDSLSSSDIQSLRNVSFIPVANGTRLVPPSSLYTRLPMDLSPFVFQLPNNYLPFTRVLEALGLQDSPGVGEMKDLLTNLQRTCGDQRLNPNELRAVLKILRFIFGEGTESVNEAEKDTVFLRHLHRLEDIVVPDDGARLVVAKSCVYVDSRGSRLLGEINTSRVRFVHPQVSESICAAMGVQKLSDIVVEELDNLLSLEYVSSIQGFPLSSLPDKLRGEEFKEALWAVIREHAEVIPSLNNVARETVLKALSRVAEGLRFVKRIYTRFFLMPTRIDITLPTQSDVSCSPSLVSDISQFSTEQASSSRENFGGGGGGGEVSGRRVFDFVDLSRSIVYIAEPPQNVSLWALLSSVLSRVLGSPVTLPIVPLLESPIGQTSTVRSILRLGLPAGMLRSTQEIESAWNRRSVLERSGLPGTEVLAGDAALLQCHPLRRFHVGEVVAWKQTGGGMEGGNELPWVSSGGTQGQVLRYGRVLEDCRVPAGQALYRVQVETGPGEIRCLLSTAILSFRGSTSTSPPGRLGANQRSGYMRLDSNQMMTSFSSHPETGTSSIGTESRPSGGGSLSLGVGANERAPPGTVPAAEVAQAVADMMASAGLPLGLDRTGLLEKAFSLQEQLTAVQSLLAMEQVRGEMKKFIGRC